MINLFQCHIDRQPFSHKPTKSETGGIQTRLNANYGKNSAVTTNIDLLSEAIQKGCTVRPCLCQVEDDLNNPRPNGKGYKQKYMFVSQQLILADIDNETKDKHRLPDSEYMTLDKIGEILQENGLSAFIVYHSFSSKPDWEKFRVGILVDEPITDKAERDKCVLAIFKLFGMATDTKCKDVARIFYGSKSDSILFNEGCTVPKKALLDLHGKLFPQFEMQQAKQQTFSILPDISPKSNNSPEELLAMIDVTALEYDDWFRVSSAYKKEGGDFSYWQSWNALYSKDDRKADLTSWNSATGEGLTMGTLVHFAKEHSPENFEHYRLEKKRDARLKITGTSTKKLVPYPVATPEKPYTWDNVGESRRMLEMFKGKILYVPTEKEFFYYDERGKWILDEIQHIETLFDIVTIQIEEAEKFYLDDEKQLKAYGNYLTKVRTYSHKMNTIKELQHHIATPIRRFDKGGTLLNVKNGVLDLTTGQLLPHSPERLLTNRIDIDYHSNAPEPTKWLQFLRDILPDEETIRFIQKALGYSLTASTEEQCAFFCFGNGKNGKSTFFEVLRKIIGDYSVNIQPETIMKQERNASSASGDLARLRSKRFLTAVEPNRGCVLNDGLVKSLTGGDKITARKLYCDEFEFTPAFKIWMGTNYKPVVLDTSEGIWRRIRLIPFTAYIPENKRDKKLIQKLMQEKESILKWMVEGCAMWQKEGLAPSRAVAQASEEYRRENDKVHRFLDECCVMGQGSVKASVLYQAYSTWSEDNGERPFSNNKFSEELKKRNCCQYVRKKEGGYYFAVTLTPEMEQKLSLTVGI